MDKKKIKRLREHAKTEGYNILEDRTARLQNAFSDDTITIRIPKELKELLKDKASSLHIPYQRFVKSVLIEAVKKKIS